MADFSRALDLLLKLEGGYSNDPADKGGETYRGISRKNWPDWTGWLLVDAWNADGKKWPTGAMGLDDAVNEFYRGHFWDPIHGDEIKDQGITQALFVQAVNGGPATAIRQLQAVLGVIADGIMGPNTLHTLDHAISSLGARSVLNRYLSRWSYRYSQIVAADPSQARFQKGWGNRLEAIRRAA